MRNDTASILDVNWSRLEIF